MNDDPKSQSMDESPPIFKTWRAWYILVIGNLILLITLFYLFTKIFE